MVGWLDGVDIFDKQIPTWYIRRHYRYPIASFRTNHWRSRWIMSWSPGVISCIIIAWLKWEVWLCVENPLEYLFEKSLGYQSRVFGRRSRTARWSWALGIRLFAIWLFDFVIVVCLVCLCCLFYLFCLFCFVCVVCFSGALGRRLHHCAAMQVCLTVEIHCCHVFAISWSSA